jgi:cytochrome c oxidase subunit 4
MSDHSASAHGDGHHHAPDHVPHVTPLSVYMKTFGALVALTIITVAASRVHLGSAVNLAVALIIATIKASVVAAMFMHLAFDHKFHTIIFVSSVVFLGVFVSFTMFDTEARGEADHLEKNRPVDSKDPFAKPKGLTTVVIPAAPMAPPQAPATAAPSASAAPEPAPSASASAEPESSASAPPATSASAPVAPSSSAGPGPAPAPTP